MFFDLFFAAAFLDALTHVIGFFLSAWGILFIIWGGVKAARRVFWIEAEPWKSPQPPALDEVRRRFAQRIVLGLLFLLAGEIVRLLTDQSPHELMRVGVLVVVTAALLFATREPYAGASAKRTVRIS